MAFKKHKEKIDEKKLKIISFISFLFGFSQALLVYIESSYFKEALGSENVSVFYFVAYAIALLGLLKMHRIIKKIGRATAFFLFFFVQLCAITFLSLLAPSYLGIALLMIYIISSYLVLVVLDIILETYSEDKKSGRIRGFHLMVMNVGFLLGPFLSTKLLEDYDYSGLFFVSMFLNMLIFVIALLGLRDGNNKKLDKLTSKDLVKKVFVNVDLMHIYSISFALEFFYALMVMYTPLYLLDLGLGWDEIGIIFSVMLLPFVLFGYLPGVIADKKLGEKEMIIGALILTGFSTGMIYFIESNSVLLWCAILFLTRIGAAFIETLRDSYFYKKIDGRDTDLISFFRTARSVGYLVSTAISAVILIFLPVKAVFLFIAVVVFLALIPARRLVNNKCEADFENCQTAKA